MICIIVTAPFLIYTCDFDGSNERNGNMDVCEWQWYGLLLSGLGGGGYYFLKK